VKQDSAVALLAQARHNVGTLLAEFRHLKKNPDPFSSARRAECSKQLSLNQVQASDLIKRFPSLCPQDLQLRLDL
jgi:hypothetical protein